MYSKKSFPPIKKRKKKWHNKGKGIVRQGKAPSKHGKGVENDPA